MFTGLVEKTGTLTGRILSGEAGKLTVEPATPFDGLSRGESIAVNGVCLTLESGMTGGPLVFHVLRETFSRTNLGILKLGSTVNLERAMSADGRFGGHFVSGHVDACAEILEIRHRLSDTEIRVAVPEGLQDYFVEKGSVAVDGVSLTIEAVSEDSFRIGLIPTTLSHTNLATLKAGAHVNIETDLLGKYVVQTLKRMQSVNSSKSSGVTMQTLSEAGFL